MRMTTNQDNADDDSFIIVLGTSPGASMDVEKHSIENGILEKSQIEDAMKDMSAEANMAFKAQFKLGDSPSAASMMVASTIITDDRSTEELQKRFGDLLDENLVLKETLKQNNDSMKEQFLLIASCQEDMLRTHKLHKEKFDETKALVEKLRQENRKLKLDVVRMAEGEAPGLAESQSGASSGVEFVTSPDDDTIDKLTAQLELVEKQRRQVIVENEKLTWQKESLEHIVDVTTKERDDLKQKVNNLELQLSSKDSAHAQEINRLQLIIKELQTKLKANENVPLEELEKRNATVAQLEGKLAALQNDLKTAQIKILDLENIKLEFIQHKSGVAETVKMYKEQIQDLSNRLKETQKTVFQPVHLSFGSELSAPTTATSEYAQYTTNVKVYSRSLKHLAEILDGLANGLSDSLVQTLGVVSSLYDFKLERASADRVRSGLGDVKQQLERQHDMALANIGQVRAAVSIFEGIFKDFTELLKKVVSKQENSPQVNVETLTAALVARGQEVQALRNDLVAAVERNEDVDLLKAQVELYKSDFEAEREARQLMAGEKEHLATDLRTAQRRIQELVTQLEEVRKLSPRIHGKVTTKRPLASGAQSPPSPPSPGGFVPAPSAPAAAARPGAGAVTTGNMVYTCPKCQRFSSDQMKAMDDHFDYCLEDFTLLR